MAPRNFFKPTSRWVMQFAASMLELPLTDIITPGLKRAKKILAGSDRVQ